MNHMAIIMAAAMTCICAFAQEANLDELPELPSDDEMQFGEDGEMPPTPPDWGNGEDAGQRHGPPPGGLGEMHGGREGSAY